MKQENPNRNPSNLKQMGYRALLFIIKLNPKSKTSEFAWFFLTWFVDDRKKKFQCLECVLAQNPGNRFAQREIEKLRNAEYETNTNETKYKLLNQPVVLVLLSVIALIALWCLCFTSALVSNNSVTLNSTPKAPSLPTLPPTYTPRSPIFVSTPVRPPSNDRVGCCKICTTGKACGNSCISRSYTCHQPSGCACNASSGELDIASLFRDEIFSTNYTDICSYNPNALAYSLP